MCFQLSFRMAFWKFTYDYRSASPPLAEHHWVSAFPPECHNSMAFLWKVLRSPTCPQSSLEAARHWEWWVQSLGGGHTCTVCTMYFFFILICFYFFIMPCGMGESLFPDQGSNPWPLHWMCGVWTTGLPGKSLYNVLLINNKNVFQVLSLWSLYCVI